MLLSAVLAPILLLPLSISFSADAATINNGGNYTLDQDTDTNKILQRNAVIQAKLAQNPVRGMRKMSDDEGEKFLLEYWDFFDKTTDNVTTGVSVQWSGDEGEGGGGHSGFRHDGSDSTLLLRRRSYPFQPAFEKSLHASGPLGDLRGFRSSRNIFLRVDRRDFKCPVGTYSCLSIDRPDSCCGTGDVCKLVQDTTDGSEDVGCCPVGQSCSGAVGSCQEGYTTCPDSLGGGCCVPGYECVSGGCKFLPVSWRIPPSCVCVYVCIIADTAQVRLSLRLL